MMALTLLIAQIIFTRYNNAIAHTIDTTLGRIKGTKHTASNPRFSTFFGIPYTEDPPTGNKRFRPSIKRTSSFSTTPFDATDVGSACIQPPEFIPANGTSEDCLKLNIWTRDVTDSLPVMVWIHGGGLETGSGYFGGMYDGKGFAKKGIVFVSINYRLGLLGFLPLQQIADETGNTNGGMMGIYDQIVALQWVKSYIHNFGGDPSQVTIFGESSGSISVCTLLFSPIATGLFTKVIMQSGVCRAPIRRPIIASPKQWAETEWAPSMLQSYGMSSDDLTDLRSRGVEEFRNLGPLHAVDGYIMPNDNVVDAITTLNANKIMIGANSIDTALAWPHYWNVGPNRNISVFDGTPTTSDEMMMYLTAYFDQDDDGMATSIMDNYYKADQFQPLDEFNKYQIMWLMMNGDSWAVCPAFELAQWIVSNPGKFSGDTNTDLYVYHFVGSTAPYYATHASEILFVFDLDLSVLRAVLLQKNQMTWDRALADKMNTAWANFAKDEDDDNLVPYENNAQKVMIFGGINEIEMVSGYYQGYRDGWCPFLSTQYSAQGRLFCQNVTVDVSEGANAPFVFNVGLNPILVVSMLTNVILVTLVCFILVNLKRSSQSIAYAQVALEEIEDIK
eukprot:478335_1